MKRIFGEDNADGCSSDDTQEESDGEGDGDICGDDVPEDGSPQSDLSET